VVYTYNMSESFKLNTEPVEDLKIERFEIEQIAPALNEIVLELGPAIENGEYDTFIGEDASGRIPAIIIWQAAKEVSSWKGKDQPDLRFVVGTQKGHVSPEKLEGIRTLLKKTDKLKKKLIVTEFVFSGNSLKAMTNTIKEAGFEADVAVVHSDYMSKEDLESKLGCKVYLGGIARQPKIYRSKISGVIKNEANLFSEKALDQFVSQKEINEAREESLSLGSYLADSYIKGRQQHDLDEVSNFKNPL